MSDTLIKNKQAYAELLLRAGVNLQPGESVLIRGELGHREFVRLLVATAYDLGARFVLVDWSDPLSTRARYQHVDRQYLGYIPEYEITRRREFIVDKWKLVSLTGTEYPAAYEDVDPTILMEERRGFAAKLKFFMQATMANQIAWNVAAVPVAPWAKKVFPELGDAEALERLWGSCCAPAERTRPIRCRHGPSTIDGSRESTLLWTGTPCAPCATWTRRLPATARRSPILRLA